jgi:cytochrome c
MISGSKMAFRLASAEQRAQVLVYLRTLSEAPKALPAAEKKTDAPAPKPDEKKAEPPKPAEAPKAAEPPKPATPPAEEKKN